MPEPDFSLVFCPLWGPKVPWTAPAYVLEAVRSRGYRVQYLDYNVRLYWETATPLGWRHFQQDFWKNADLACLLDHIDLNEIRGDVVGFSVTESNLHFSVALARRLRRHAPAKTIIFGGHGVCFPEDARIPPDACDVLVAGEGELTLLDILARGGRDIPGTYTHEAGLWRAHGQRELMADLDLFPWPSYQEVDWDLYPARELAIMSSRGCVYRCVFCDDIVRAGHRYRHRSARHIVEEMGYHRREHGVRFTAFNDSILNADLDHFDALCEGLLADGHDRPWAGNFAIRRNMPEDLMRKARRAGFRIANLGLESGSPRVLSRMRKPFGPDDAASFLAQLHRAGIDVAVNLIVGFPGETDRDLQATLDLLTRLRPHITQIASICPFMLNRSYLGEHLGEFGVERGGGDRSGIMGAIDWTSDGGGNTWEVRSERYQRLVGHARALGLVGDWYSGFPAALRRPITAETIERRRSRLVGADAGRRRRALYLWCAPADASDARARLERRAASVCGLIDADPARWYRLVQGLLVYPPAVLAGSDARAERPFVMLPSDPPADSVRHLDMLGYRPTEDYACVSDPLSWLIPDASEDATELD
jgi:hypothetical protein